MSDTMWFTKTNDNIGGKMLVMQGSERNGDPTTLLLTDVKALPNWVMTPDEIGGQMLKVLGSFQQQCPVCKGEVLVRHIECSDGFFVAECVEHGFVWYKRPKDGGQPRNTP